MYAEMFRFRNFGHGSALAVILLVTVIPIMVINIRNLRRQRSMFVPLIVFFALQRYFVRGLLTGSVKG